jgi:hypothetical protein
VITVTLREFAWPADIDRIPARMMTLVEEPRTRRLFVSEMRGVLYTVSRDGKTVTPFLDLRDPKWAVAVQSEGRERGMQSFVLHPQFAQAGTPGVGKFYTYTDVSNQTPAPDFTTPNPNTTHDTVLLERTANRSQGKAVAERADMRFDANAAGQIFVLNKADGTIRVVEKWRRDALRRVHLIPVAKKWLKLSARLKSPACP